MKPVVLVLLLFIISSGCRNKNTPPRGILGKEKMQEVLWDVIGADVYTHSYLKKDSSKNLFLENAKFQQQIFDKHHVSKEDFYSSYEYYKKHPEFMTSLLDSMISRKERDRNLHQQDKKLPLHINKRS